jgi:glyoxylase-like metal-dependent hydrolase (beta-lactamase superfamily II)
VSEILPGIHRIESVYNGRLITCHLLRGERTLLVDSGFPHTATETIIPYLDSIGVSDIHWLVTTHASGDHFGGNAAIKHHSPQVQIIAHTLDADAISNHATFIQEHITFFQKQGVPLAEVKLDDLEFIRLHGPEAPIDQTLASNAHLSLSGTWQVDLLRAPGHTPGHLMLYDPLHRALISGDALMGAGVPNLAGGLDMPPHYFDANWYIQTIRTARALEPQHLFATHYAPRHGSGVQQFLDESETFVEHFEASFLTILESQRTALSVADLIQASRGILGIPEATYQYGMLVLAHLKSLKQKGYVQSRRAGTTTRWRLKETYV